MPISILACPYRYWTSDVEHLVEDATVVGVELRGAFKQPSTLKSPYGYHGRQAADR